MLEPHRLPDTSRSRIPDLVRCGPPVLLPARDLERARLVVGTHDEFHRLTVGCTGDLGHVDRERRVTADVSPDQRAVGPHPRFTIHRPEVDEDLSPFEPTRLDVDPPAIPAPAEEPLAADTTRFGFGRERNLDDMRELDVSRMRDRRVRIQREVPLSVEQFPRLAPKLRSRMARITNRHFGHLR